MRMSNFKMWSPLLQKLRENQAEPMRRSLPQWMRMILECVSRGRNSIPPRCVRRSLRNIVKTKRTK